MDPQKVNKNSDRHFDFRGLLIFVLFLLFLAKISMLKPCDDVPSFVEHRQCHTTCSLYVSSHFSTKNSVKIAKASSNKTTLLYLCSLLVMQSADTEMNPGPRGRPPKYPCGSCNKAVKWNDDKGGVFCENCRVWFHAACEGMSKHIYDIIGNNSISWICTNCAMPNFSSALFDLSTYEDSRYEILNSSDLNSPRTPEDLGPPPSDFITQQTCSKS